MSAILQLGAMISPALIAWLVLRRYLAERGPAANIELVGIALAFGVGFTSIVFFLWRLIGMPPGAYLVADIGLQALLAGVVWNGRRHEPPPVPAAADVKETKALRVLSALAVAASICVAAVLLNHFVARTPYGEWDGWAIWNLRAAFLSAGTDHWRDGFTPILQWSHPDYPLLLPASVARLWSVADVRSAFGPQLLGISAVVSTALVMAGSVLRRAGFLGMALALSLLLIPNYLHWGVSQTADVPLGLYMLIAVASLAAARSAPRYVVAGLAVGFVVWTKNEGLAVAAAVLITIVALRRSRHDVPLLGWLAAGFAVGGLALLLFKLTLSPPGQLLEQIASHRPLEKLADADRHGVVAWSMGRGLFTWGGWFPIPGSVLLVACIALASVHWRSVPKEVGIGGGVVGLMVCAYYGIYVMSLYDLEWHLFTTWERLIAQLWPTMIWTVVIAAAASFSSGRDDVQPR